jgi:hypothetical protein
MWIATADLALLVSRDRGQSFERVPDGPLDSYLRSLAADPFDPATVYGVTESGQIWVYRDDTNPQTSDVPAQIPEVSGT